MISSSFKHRTLFTRLWPLCSNDGGHSWQNAFESLEIDVPLAATALAARGHHLFAGVKGGILRSSDGGHTWFAASLPHPPPLVTALALSPGFADDGTLLAATAEDGVFSSVDRGTHWSPWNFGLIDLNINAMVISPDIAHDQIVFVGTESGIFRSKNGGRAWRALPFPVDAAPVLSLGISSNFVSDHCLFAGTESSGLYISTDRGQTWRVSYLAENLTSVNSIVCSDSAISVMLDNSIVQSLDQGQTWTTTMSFPEQTGTALHIDRDVLAVGFAEGGVKVITTDGLSDPPL